MLFLGAVSLGAFGAVLTLFVHDVGTSARRRCLGPGLARSIGQAIARRILPKHCNGRERNKARPGRAWHALSRHGAQSRDFKAACKKGLKW
jgi:hypothetical protein